MVSSDQGKHGSQYPVDTIKDGVLEIRVPKTEEAASRTRQEKVE